MKTAAFLVVLSMLLLSTAAQAVVPGLISYQGTLTDDGGVALDTTVAMTFTIYYDSTGAAYIWTETQPSVVVTNGIFNVLLGSVNSLSEGLFGGTPSRWLGVQVGGDPELTPRQRIVTVAHAFHAAVAETASYALSAPAASDGDWVISGINMYAGVSGNVGIGTSAPAFNLDIQDSYPFVRIKGSAGNAGLVIDKLGAADFGHVMYRAAGADRWAAGLLGDSNYRIRYWPTTTDVMYLHSSGDVGIGTTSPEAKLDCPGPVRIGSPVFVPSGTVSLALCANDNTWTSIPLAIRNTDNDYLFYVRGNGDVGVGTWNPSAKLDVVGTAKMTGFTMPTGAVNGHVLTSDGSGNGTWQAGFAGYWTDWGSYIEANDAGNFEIWDNTSGPTGLIHVYETETKAVTNWYNDGSVVRHCYNDDIDSELFGMMSSVTSGLTDFGTYSYGEEWGGYFDCGAGGTAVYGRYDSNIYGYLGDSVFGAYGQSQTDVYGILGGPGYGVFGQNTSRSYAKLGNSVTEANYFYHRELEANGDGQTAAYAYRTRDSQNDGTGYGVSISNTAVKAYNLWGDLYSFGAAGYNYNDYTRCGGTFGANVTGSYWGSLGYKTSGSLTYGGYATAWGTGTGKDEVSTGIGLGAWGELFGADIHGKVYGAYLEGGHYASYSNGDVFKNGMDVHLHDTETSSMAVLYTNVSTDVTVQTSGFATLSGGKSTISFDEHFRSVVSPEVPIVVTVTPIGDCNGVHVLQVTRDGFTVVENNAGKSSVQVAFIAVGRRAGYEDPRLPKEVVSADYVDKISRGLHNDADTETDGEGLFFEDGQLVVGVHPSTLPDPNKPAEELEHVPSPEVPQNHPAEDYIRRPLQGNIDPERVRTRQSD